MQLRQTGRILPIRLDMIARTTLDQRRGTDDTLVSWAPRTAS